MSTRDACARGTALQHAYASRYHLPVEDNSIAGATDGDVNSRAKSEKARAINTSLC